MAEPNGIQAMTEPKKIRPIALTIRGSVAWREWVERLARHESLDVAKLVDRALRREARAESFGEAPPSRLE